MQVLHPVSEEEIIAAYLRAEFDSSRYGSNLRALLAKDERDSTVITQPDFNQAANAYRRQLLERHRRYESRTGMFHGFPTEIEWLRVALAPEEVLEILFLNSSWWLRLSAGSRRPRDAARLLSEGQEPDSHQEHEAIARALGPGTPELIVVSESLGSHLVLVEGHNRLLSYALYPDVLPPALEVFLGVAPALAGWSEF